MRAALARAAVLVSLAASLVAGCGTGAAACKVVDVASDTCAVVRYLGPDGQIEDLDANDLAVLARAKRIARERAEAQVAP